MGALLTPPISLVAAASPIVDRYLCEICQTPIPEIREGGAHDASAWASLLAFASGRSLPLYLDSVHRLAASAVPLDAQHLDGFIEGTRGTPSAWMRMLRNAWHFVVAARERPRDKRLRGLADLAIRQLITTSTPCDYVPPLPHRLVLGQRFRVVVPERICLAATLVAWVHLNRDLEELDEGILVWEALDFIPDIPVVSSAQLQSADSRNRDEDTGVELGADVICTDLGEDPATDTCDFPKRIAGKLREVVLGQEAACRSFAACAWRHYLGVQHGAVLITGATGTGKTLLASSWAALADRPVVRLDASSLVPEGIRGGSLMDGLLSLVRNADHDLQAAEGGILILDEFDKLSVNHYRDQLESALLGILSGAPVCGFEGERQPGPQKVTTFATKRLMVVLIGCWSAERRQTGIGFGGVMANTLSSPVSSRPLALDQLIASDELRGRIAQHIELAAHDADSLRRILLSDEGPLRVLRTAYPAWTIKPGEDLIQQVIGDALSSGLGARGLSQRIAAIEEEIFFNPPTMNGTYGGLRFVREVARDSIR